MNGVHDMGGMHGLGAMEIDPDEPIFHAPWEARVLAMTLAVGAWGRWNIDASRHARERIPGTAYLAMTYYEKWLAGLTTLIVEHGLATDEEVRTGARAADAAVVTPALKAAEVAAALARGGPANRNVTARVRFAIGDKVRTRNANPPGHTRLPRYARGRAGIIERDHGVHVLPDTNAHFRGECPERLYGVRFSAAELWGGDVGARDSVHIDLWDSYLDPA